MTDNEIKKAIYKDSPIATFSHYRKGYLHYTAWLNTESKELLFIVPITDTGDADFHREMEAKLLIRYLNN